jgi:hypothetical protein
MTLNSTTGEPIWFELPALLDARYEGSSCYLGAVHVAIVTAGYLSFGPIEKYFMFSVTLACARRTGAAARVERRRRER